MFKFFKNNFNKSNEAQSNNTLLSFNDLKKELQEKFSDYDSFDKLAFLAFDECWYFIYKNIKDFKDTLIIASTLRQIEPTVEEVMKAYSLNEDYIKHVVSEKIPQLRLLAYKRLEELSNEDVAFFPGFHNNYEPLYKNLIVRMDYLFEVKRNTQKLFSELNGNGYCLSLANNSSFLFLLNYLSVMDALIVASSLDVIDIDDEEVQTMYPHETEYFQNIFNNNISLINNSLSERITNLENTELETSHFDYIGLCDQYKDLKQRIDDTIDYLKDKPTCSKRFVIEKNATTFKQ